MKRIRRKTLPAALIGAFGASVLLAAGGASAQQAQKVEKIEVTGTNIKRTDVETPSVVQVITREQIERSGATSVAELLREVPAIAGGSAQDFDGGTGFQRGNQTASLRGLGSVATLVLLNGRRIAPAPYADPNLGQGSSYNLNTIPISAIERIDVLKDGASAIYGSDAIAGVINVILRKDYRGAEIAWSHWQKLDQFEDMNYRTEQLSGAIGFGDLARDRYNVLIAGEILQREPQRLQESGSGIRNDDYRRLANRLNAASELAFPANMRRATGTNVFGTAGRLPGDARCPTALRTTVGTGSFNASAPFVCTWNTFDALNIVSELDRFGLLGRLTYQLTGNITAFVDAGFTRNTSTFPANPPSLSAAAPSTWFNRAGQRFSYQLVLPVGHPDNPNSFPVGLLYRFADLGSTRTEVETDSSRVVAGLNGVFGSWDWESAIMWGRTERNEVSNGILYFPALLAAVNSGAYRFSGNAQNSQSLLDSLHPDFRNVGRSTVTQWDLKGSRELFNMRNGPVMLALGIEARKEEMDIVSDPRTVAGEFLGVASSTVNADRNVWSVFGEVQVPILKNLEAQLAARHDRYSDFGSSTTPKVGLKWNASNQLAVRSTYARGFRAPSLFQIATGDVQSFNAGIVDPIRCPNGALPQAPGAEPEDCNRTISSLIRANPNLKPEKSSSNTLGFIWAPSSNYSLSIDRWYVHRTSFIDRYSSPFVITQNFLGNPLFANAVIRDPNPASWLPGIPNSGPIQSTIRRFDNFGGTAVRGYDLDAQVKFPMGAMGRLSVDANATYYDKLLWKLGTDVPYISGLGNFYIFEAPRFRGSVTGTWETGAWSLLTRYNYTAGWDYGEPTQLVGGVTSTGPFQCYLGATSLTLAFLGRCHVEAFETWDVGASWTGIKNLKVGVLVRNVTNKAAPYDPNQPTLGFNPTFANPYGRYMQLSVSYKFR